MYKSDLKYGTNCCDDQNCLLLVSASVATRYVLERHSLELGDLEELGEESVTGAEHIDLANQV